MNSNATLRNTVPLWRILVFALVVASVFVVYLFRLFGLQILQAPEWLAQSEENRISQINIPAQRGIIFDRNDFILARNIAAYNVVITPANLPDDLGAVQDIFRQLSKMTATPINRGELTPDAPYAP